MKKKVLVLYGSYGGGHLSAAKAISKYYETNYEDIEIKLIDCIEYINKYINKVSTEAYKEMAKKAPWVWKQVYNKSKSGALAYLSNATNKLLAHKLLDLLEEENPYLIISTHPFATQMCTYLKEKEKVNYRLATILTDFHIHPQWLVSHEENNYFFVSNEQMKMDMINYGIDDEKIFVSGIPISENFSEKLDTTSIYSEFNLSKDKKTILFFAGGEFGLGRNTTFMILKAIIRLFPEIQVIAISGKNKEMKEKFETLVTHTHSEDRIKILDYTNKVPELMKISCLVITKPGGLTVSETLASNVPLIIINPIPGQEEENAQFLVDNNVAIRIKNEDNISRALKYLFKNEDNFKTMIESTKKLAKPQSTKMICDYLYNEIINNPAPEPIVKEPKENKIKKMIVDTKDKLEDGIENAKDKIENHIETAKGKIENKIESVKEKIDLFDKKDKNSKK